MSRSYSTERTELFHEEKVNSVARAGTKTPPTSVYVCETILTNRWEKWICSWCVHRLGDTDVLAVAGSRWPSEREMHVPLVFPGTWSPNCLLHAQVCARTSVKNTPSSCHFSQNITDLHSQTVKLSLLQTYKLSDEQGSQIASILTEIVVMQVSQILTIRRLMGGQGGWWGV